MIQSHPTWLLSRLLLLIWWRQAKSILGHPLGASLCSIGVLTYVLLAWQAPAFIGQFMAGQQLQVNLFTRAFMGTLLGSALIATWFVAQRVVGPSIPQACTVLPVEGSSWLSAQWLPTVGLTTTFNCLLLAPLYYGLRPYQPLGKGWWLIAAFGVTVFWSGFGGYLFALIEWLRRKIANSRRNTHMTAYLHPVGQLSLLGFVWLGTQFYPRSLAGQLNVNLPITVYFRYYDNWSVRVGLALAVTAGAVAITVLAMRRIRLWHRIRSRTALRPFTSRLTSRLHPGCLRLVLRSCLSDRESLIPNGVVLGSITLLSLAVHYHWVAARFGLFLYGIHGTLLLLVFGGMSLHTRGRLGVQRTTLYALPTSPLSCITKLFGASVSLAAANYFVCTWFIGHLLGQENTTNISSLFAESCLAATVASLAFLIGVITLAGHAHSLYKLPATLGFLGGAGALWAGFGWMMEQCGPGLAISAAAIFSLVCLGSSQYYERMRLGSL